MYEYLVRTVRVIDGDTLRAGVDLGCDVMINLTLRLARLDAPEIKEPGGLEARDFLADRVNRGPFHIRTIKDRRERYGRYLAEVLVDGQNVNDEMLAGGYARAYP
jgi:micrococcal nuclease